MAGQLWQWGRNSFGVLGDGTTTNRSSPVQNIAGASNWAFVSQGKYHTGAIKTDGTLWTWGYNSQGQLGDNTVLHRSSPIQVISGGSWSQVSCKNYYTLAIKTDGTLWTWGNNSFGSLGDNTTTFRSSPVQIFGGGNDWSQVEAGGYFCSAAIKKDGTLWMWGFNGQGYLGDNTQINKSSPAQTITGGNNWSKVSIGSIHVAALKTDGTLWTWGDNYYGELGDNTNISKSSPVQTIARGTDWKQVVAGDYFTIAIKSDGSLWSFGNNGYGQLGNPDKINRSSPIQVLSDNKWKFVSAGYGRVTAVQNNNTMWTWGSNYNGQLGDNTTINKSSPVQTVMGGNRWTSISSWHGENAAIYENTPSALSITTQPANAYNAQKILNQPVVAVVDSAGNIVTTSQAVITAAVASGTPSLTGTINILVSGGIAQFTDLSLSGIGSGSLIFTASGLTSAISDYISIDYDTLPIIPKRSEFVGRVPNAEQLLNGELAINIADKKGYVKNSSGSIVNVFTGLGADVIASGMIGENAVTMRDIAPGAVGPSELASGVIGGTNTQILYNQSGSIAGTAALTLSTSSGVVTIAPQNAGYNALTLRSYTSQSADLLKIQNSAGSDIARITSSGAWVGPIGSGNIISGYIASGQIGAFHLASGVISTAVLGSGQVTSGSIASGSVGQFQLSSGAVNSGHIGNAAVVSGSIASGQIGTFHIASGSITANLIASGAIITADIADNAVVSGKIASGVVAWFNLASGAVRSGHIGDNAVVSGSIASGQIWTFHFASGALIPDGGTF